MYKYKFIIFGLVTLALTGCANLPHIYSGKAVHGWVVDAKNNEPIEGVIVVEIWELFGNQNIIYDEGDHNGNIHIAETLTDKKGHYEFSKWGPKFTMDGSMDESSPHLIFYKFGYDDVQLHNRVSGNPNRDNSVSEYTGKIIKLEKFNGTPEEYQIKLENLEYVLSLSSNRKGLKCSWAKMPKFTAEMIQLSRYFEKYRISNGSFPPFESIPKSKCGDRDTILKDYLK